VAEVLGSAPPVEAARRAKEYDGALRLLASMRSDVDLFFDKVLVHGGRPGCAFQPAGAPEAAGRPFRVLPTSPRLSSIKPGKTPGPPPLAAQGGGSASKQGRETMIKKGTPIKPRTGSSESCCRAWRREFHVHRRDRGRQARRGPPIGSLTQMGTIRLGKRTENRVPRIKTLYPWLPWTS